MFVALFSGCSGENKLHEKIIIKGVGVDLYDGNIEVTMHVFDSENSVSDGKGKIIVISSTGKTVLDAFNNLSKKTGKEPLYSQNLVLIIGKECAQNGINAIMDFFIRYYEVRPSVSVFVSDTTAKDILKCRYDGFLITCEEISALSFMGDFNASGKSADVTEVVNDLCGDITDPAVMALKVTADEQGQRPETSGTAIFNKDKLAGFLNTSESKGFMLLKGNIKGGTFVLDLNNSLGTATITFNDVTAEYSFDTSEEKLKIKIDIFAQLNLYALDNSEQRHLPNTHIDYIEELSNIKLKEYAVCAIEKSVKEYNSDSLNLGKRLRLYETDYFKEIQNNHRSCLSSAVYEINVQSQIKNIGQEMGP